MTTFVLKIIAIVTMFCNHLGYAISDINLVIIGDIAFPIFAFLISEGYKNTKSVKKYLMRLVTFALISQIPFYLFNKRFIPEGTNTLNIFFTLALGLISIIVYDYFKNLKRKEFNYKFGNIEINKIIGFIAVILISYIANVINVDYGYWGVIVIFAFYLFKENKTAMIISYIALCVLMYALYILTDGFNIYYIYMFIIRTSSIIFILAYNGKQGYKLKYFFYAFYPIHLLLLYFFV